MQIKIGGGIKLISMGHAWTLQQDLKGTDCQTICILPREMEALLEAVKEMKREFPGLAELN